MSLKKYHTPKTEIYQDEQGIIYVNFKDDKDEVEFDVSEARNQLDTINLITNGEKRHVIIDTSMSFLSPTKEAKNLLAEYPLKKSEAIIVKHLHQRITVAFFLKISKRINQHPIQLFTDKNKAYNWTVKQMQNEKVINDSL